MLRLIRVHWIVAAGAIPRENVTAFFLRAVQHCTSCAAWKRRQHELLYKASVENRDVILI